MKASIFTTVFLMTLFASNSISAFPKLNIGGCDSDDCYQLAVYTYGVASGTYLQLPFKLDYSTFTNSLYADCGDGDSVITCTLSGDFSGQDCKLVTCQDWLIGGRISCAKEIDEMDKFCKVF